MKESITKSSAGARKRVQIMFTEPTLTKQSFKDECNINRIVSRFQSTGQLPSNIKTEHQYGFAPEFDFKEALDLTQKLKTEFQNLSPEIRAEFDDDHLNYADFLSNYAAAPERFTKAKPAKPVTKVQEPDESLKGDLLDPKE